MTTSGSPRAAIVEQVAVAVLSVAAGIAGAMITTGFTASTVTDRAWTAMFAALVVVAAARAGRMSILVLVAASLGVSLGSNWLIAAGAALVLSIITQRDDPPIRWRNALIGALASVAMLHPPAGESTALLTALILIGVVPLVVSALRSTSGASRRRVLTVGVLLGSVVGVVTLVAVVLGILAMPSLRSAVSASRDGVGSTKSGELEQATGSFASAATDFSRASDLIGSILMEPARFLPVIGANITTARSVIEAGQQLTSSAESTVSAAPYNTVKLSEDGLDLEQITAMQEPVATLDLEVAEVQRTLADLDTDWLFPPIASRVEEFTTQIDDVSPQIHTASMALDTLPDLLGANGSRTYLVEFTSESESRFLGGFVGSYALLTADHGHLTLDRSESVSTLNRRLGPDTDYVAPVEFRNLYDRFHPQMFAQNWTVAPDLPSDVAMVEQLFAQATGVRIDGVMVIDPFGLASLLRLTGPIRVDGIKGALTAENAAEYLLHGQYLEFDGQTDERRDQLAAVGKKAFDELLRSSKTTYREVGRALGPSVAGGHIMFSVLEPSGQLFLDRLGLTGRFEAPAEAGMFSFRNSASFANKIDYFLHRSIHLDTTIDPATSRFDSDVTIELRNDAPSDGLPTYVIGNENGEPTGTNGMYFSIYTSFDLTDAVLDGQSVRLLPQPDRGMRVFSRGITIPPGGTRTLRFHLSGVVPPSSSGYSLLLPHQPTVHDDHVSLTVRSTDPKRPVSAISGFENATVTTGDNSVSAEGPVTSDQRLSIAFSTR